MSRYNLVPILVLLAFEPSLFKVARSEWGDVFASAADGRNDPGQPSLVTATVVHHKGPGIARAWLSG